MAQDTSTIFEMASSASGNFVWVKSVGGAALIIRDMDIDILGNTVVSGNFIGTIDFDPGIGSLELTSAGGTDAFVSKLTSAGELIWAASLGGPENDDALSVTTDEQMNTYVGGYFTGTADFDPGPTVYPMVAVGGADAFVCRLGPQGGLNWAVSMGGPVTNYADATWALAISQDQVIAAGSFTGSADFDPTPNSSILTAQAGGIDIFVSRLSTDGVFIGVSQIGGWEGNEFCERVVCNSEGDIILSGTFGGNVDFDPGIGVADLGPGGRFVCKWTSQAEFLWAYSGVANVVAAGSGNELYSIGTCTAGLDVDPSASVFEISQSGALTMKLNQLITTGLIDEVIFSSMNAHPQLGNSDSWLVQFPTLVSQAEYVLYDMNGRKIEEGTVAAGSDKMVIDLKEESIGIYVISLWSKGERLSARIARW